MKRWYLLLFALIVTACATPAARPETGGASLPDLGAAPELEGDIWLNSAAPLRLADLRGRVVLVDMWTFG